MENAGVSGIRQSEGKSSQQTHNIDIFYYYKDSIHRQRDGTHNDAMTIPQLSRLNVGLRLSGCLRLFADDVQGMRISSGAKL